MIYFLPFFLGLTLGLNCIALLIISSQDIFCNSFCSLGVILISNAFFISSTDKSCFFLLILSNLGKWYDNLYCK